jgi:hypothetical protein
VVWDHFFHGETFNGSIPFDWVTGATAADLVAKGVSNPNITDPVAKGDSNPNIADPVAKGDVSGDDGKFASEGVDAQVWTTAVVMKPVATAPTGMQVLAPDNSSIAFGELKATQSPPLRVMARFAAVSVSHVGANDVGPAFVRCAFFRQKLTLEDAIGPTPFFAPPIEALSCVWPMTFLSGVHVSYQFTL